MIRLLIGLILLTNGMLAVGEWKVDPTGSHLGFGSVKNDLIAENHSFTEISGTVSDEGLAQVEVTLASVETLIPIRNERMQKMLFNVSEFPIAMIRSKVPIDHISTIGDAESIVLNIDILIELHGNELKKSVPVKVTKLANDAYDVTSLGPIIIHASQFALSGNVESLRKIAGLQSIELMVPVTFDLRLVAGD